MKNEESLYEQVVNEIEKGEIKKGLWGKAFSECHGDEMQTKSLYIKLRVDSLKEELSSLKTELSRRNREKIVGQLFFGAFLGLCTLIVFSLLLQILSY